MPQVEHHPGVSFGAATATSTTAPRSLPAASGSPALRQLPLSAPFRWLMMGWRDFNECPAIGLFYGTAFMAMGWLLLSVFHHAPAYTLALSAGFLLLGPCLCLGIYQASRSLHLGETPDLGRSLLAWETRTGQLAIFGFVLLILEMLWGRASLIVFAVSFDGMPDFKGSLTALLNPENVEFAITYLSVAAVFGGLIYAVSAISIPMLLDRDTDAVTAGLTSLRLVLGQPLVMLLWALLLLVLVVVAMLPWFAGLLVVAPVLGHASWHAYREAVLPEAEEDGSADPD